MSKTCLARFQDDGIIYAAILAQDFGPRMSADILEARAIKASLVGCAASCCN